MVSKQYKYCKQWSFFSSHVTHSGTKNAPVPMIDKKKLPGTTSNNTYIPRAGTFWAVGPTYININIHRSKRTMPPRAASPLARRAGSSWWRLVWSGAQRKLPRSGSAQIKKKLYAWWSLFTWSAGRRESGFEDGSCKVLSVGAVKSAECGMMPIGSGMVPTTGGSKGSIWEWIKFCRTVLNQPPFLLSPRI